MSRVLYDKERSINRHPTPHVPSICALPIGALGPKTPYRNQAWTGGSHAWTDKVQKFLDKTEKFMQTHVETAATEAEEVHT
jgi:hypothetical protein